MMVTAYFRGLASHPLMPEVHGLRALRAIASLIFDLLSTRGAESLIDVWLKVRMAMHRGRFQVRRQKQRYSSPSKARSVA